MSRAGKKFVVWSVSFMDNVYGTARIKVPYRPKADYADGLDCTNADDVFKLYWRYTTPQKMGYMSFNGRKTNLGSTQEQKIIGELTQRGVTHMVLEEGQPVPEWFKPVVSAFKAQGGEVVKAKPMRSMPPGMDPDDYPYFVKRAWQLIYGYFKTLEWPKAQSGLNAFSAVGRGRDRNTRQFQEERVRVGAHPRGLTQDEIDQLLGGAKVKDLLDPTKLNKQQRQLAYDSQEEGTLRQIEEQDINDGTLTRKQVEVKRAQRLYNMREAQR